MEGKEGEGKEGEGKEGEGREGKGEMEVMAETVEQKSMKEYMEEEFGVGFKGFGYDNKKKFARWNVFMALLCISCLFPVLETYLELQNFYKSTKEIEDERMKEIKTLKKEAFYKALFSNQDFNKLVL